MANALLLLGSGISGASNPATLTITFGDGIVDSGNFYLIINNTQYVITFGEQGIANVAMWYYSDENALTFAAVGVAMFFETYIQNTFSSSLTVSRNVNVVTLTTIATSGASLSATCSLPIFPDAPL